MTTDVILTSAVIAAIISGVFTILNKHREGEMRYVTHEREKWRQNIRVISEEILNCQQKHQLTQTALYLLKLTRLRHRLALLLNPSDPEDLLILESIDLIVRYSQNSNDIQFKEFKIKEEFLFYELGVQFLLKHDWERIKIESKYHFTHYFMMATAAALIYVVIFNNRYVAFIIPLLLFSVLFLLFKFFVAFANLNPPEADKFWWLIWLSARRNQLKAHQLHDFHIINKNIINTWQDSSKMIGGADSIN